jgi:acyl carrier protein
MGRSLELMVEINFNLNIFIGTNMTNIEKYKKLFSEAFEIEISTVESLEYESIPAWDSVGHMVLVAALEEGFDIMLEMDDIIDFSSFEKGKEILKGYDIIL